MIQSNSDIHCHRLLIFSLILLIFVDIQTEIETEPKRYFKHNKTERTEDKGNVQNHLSATWFGLIVGNSD